jgi:small subunit ribosomal protein S1
MIAKVDEKLMFKVIEFNKSAKKIIVSHSRVFEDEKRASETIVKKSETETPKKTTRKVKANVEKTTLGDISELAALKEEMEEKQNKSSKK